MNATTNKPVRSEQAEPERRSVAGWIFGWVVVPALVLGAIFGGGVYVGANLHESWVARAVMWVAGLFA